jgi:hypothetical protein
VAAKRLGWDAILCVEFYGDEIDARIWQVEENLSRAELAALERAEHIEERRNLVLQKGGQVAPPRGGHQPKNAGIKKTAKALGITREEVRRSKVIAGLSAKAKEEVRKLGLDDNQAALLAIAKEPAAPAQLRVVKEIAERKRADLVHRVSAAPAAVDKKIADEINALEADIQTKVGIVERVNDAVAAHRKRLHEMHDTLVVEDALAAGSEAAEQEAKQLAGEAGGDKSMVPDRDADKSARPIDDQGNFGRLQRRWEKFLALDWKDASPKTRARFVAEVLGYPERVG